MTKTYRWARLSNTKEEKEPRLVILLAGIQM